MIASSSLVISPTWKLLERQLEVDMATGMHFSDSLTMNVVIKQRDLEPYRKHRARLDEVLWYDDPGPKTIIDFGAGYGAMAGFWPEGATVYNVDLPVMLGVQKRYIDSIAPWSEEDGRPNLPPERIELVPFNEIDSIPLDNAYLFSVWALTETTMTTWQYWRDRAHVLAGAYILGHQKWVDEKVPWPWEEFATAFFETRVYEPTEPDSFELAAVNR